MKNKCFDVPILLIFFTRFETFKRVFDAVKNIRPKVLYLYQDGPRNEKDLEGINKCRELIKSIDWDCEIHKMFQEHNVGCDPSGYIAHNWFFNNVDYGIVLEDDCVPNESFFVFCKEMLEKYKDDDDIALVSGFNLLDKFSDKRDPASYFFTAHGGIWGWASWKRFYAKCDPNYTWLDDQKTIKRIMKNFSSQIEAKAFIKLAKQRKKENKAYFETLVYAAARSNGMLEIVPSMNLISNIGFGDGGTHSRFLYNKIPPKTRRLFNKKTYDLPLPLIHPKEKKRNVKYERRIEPKWYDPLVRFFYKVFG